MLIHELAVSFPLRQPDAQQYREKYRQNKHAGYQTDQMSSSHCQSLSWEKYDKYTCHSMCLLREIDF